MGPVLKFLICNPSEHERGACIKGLFWPPLESSTENCFSSISFDRFIRRLTEV